MKGRERGPGGVRELPLSMRYSCRRTRASKAAKPSETNPPIGMFVSGRFAENERNSECGETLTRTLYRADYGGSGGIKTPLV